MCLKRAARGVAHWLLGTTEPVRHERTEERIRADEAEAQRRLHDLNELTRRLDNLDQNIGLLAGRQKGRLRS